MTGVARKLLEDLLALPEEDRAELASELIASLDGPPDASWEETWLEEIDRRVAAAEESDDTGEDWLAVRARILGELRSR
jgi:putative addiction module component (TIGR02574 family)